MSFLYIILEIRLRFYLNIFLNCYLFIFFILMSQTNGWRGVVLINRGLGNWVKYYKWGVRTNERTFFLFWSQWKICIKIYLCTNKVTIYGKWKKYWSNMKTNCLDLKIWPVIWKLKWNINSGRKVFQNKNKRGCLLIRDLRVIAYI